MYSKSYHWERALTQVIILQLPRISPEGVTLYLYTLFGDDSGIRTHITGVRGQFPKPLEDTAIYKTHHNFLLNALEYVVDCCKRLSLSYIYIISYFFIKIKSDFYSWCSKWDSNPHALWQLILSQPSLPIPSFEHNSFKSANYTSVDCWIHLFIQ